MIVRFNIKKRSDSYSISTMENNNKRIAKNTVFLSVRMVIVLLIGLYISRALLSTLGVVDFGIYNVVCGFVAMFAFINTSMINGIQRFYNFEYGRNGEDGARKVYHCALITQTAIALLVVVATETFGIWYLNNKLVIPPERFTAAVYVFHFSVLSLLFPILQIPYSASITAHERMDYYAIVSVIDVILKLLIVLALPFIDYDHLVIYGLLTISINILNFLMYYIYAKRNFSELHGKIELDKKLLKNMLSFSGWNLFGSFSGVMRDQGLNLMLNSFFGPVVNAARGVAYQVSGGVQSFVVNITTASRPQLTQSYAQGNISRTFNIMYSMSKMCYISVFVFALPVLLETEYILHLWLGENIPEHTQSFVVLVVLSSLIHVYNPPTSFVVHATGKMRAYQTISSIFSLILLPVSYFFLKHGSSAEMVFVLYFIFTVLGQALCLYILHRLIPFSIIEYLKNVIWPCILLSISAAIIPIAIHVFMPYSFARFCVVVAISMLLVIFTSYSMGLNMTEKKIVKDFTIKILGKFY